MKKTNTNLMLCAMVFAVALVISNVITAKTIQTGIPLFGSTILVPSAVICYCVTFLMTDVIGEIWGRKEAQTVVSAVSGASCSRRASSLSAKCCRRPTRPCRGRMTCCSVRTPCSCWPA